MHVAEKAWAKLAKHFALRVTEADSSELQQSAEFVARYRTLAEQLWAAVVAREADLIGSSASKVLLSTLWTSCFVIESTDRAHNISESVAESPHTRILFVLLYDL